MDVLLLSPVNPFEPRDGHRMAVASDVRAILDNDLTLGVIGFLYPGQQPCPIPHAPWICDARLYPVRTGGFPLRFARGLFAGVPPSSERLYSREAWQGVEAALRLWKPRYVIVDDVSMAGYLSLIRSLAPQAKIILRTHNVMQDVRREHLKHTRGMLRIPVGHDYRSYTRFETMAVAECDAVWAISDTDASRITALYGRPAHCLSISIGEERYLPLRLDEGMDHYFVHVGTLDFRRKSDLESFLKTSWPRIRQRAPGAALTLAGQLHGKAVEAPGTTYSGPVADDAAMYRQGRYALNFQTTTGGIKLKTLTSLAAGRTLVSTRSGVEGLGLVAGKHYWEMDTFLSPDRLDCIMSDRDGARKMGQAGRDWVLDHHSRATIAGQLKLLLGRV